MIKEGEGEGEGERKFASVSVSLRGEVSGVVNESYGWVPWMNKNS